MCLAKNMSWRWIHTCHLKYHSAFLFLMGMYDNGKNANILLWKTGSFKCACIGFLHWLMVVQECWLTITSQSSGPLQCTCNFCQNMKGLSLIYYARISPLGFLWMVWSIKRALSSSGCKLMAAIIQLVLTEVALELCHGWVDSDSALK